MRNYNYKNKWQKLLTPEVVSLLTQIHEYKGEQTLFIEAKADTLTQLVEIAKIQSTEASNKIEGIYTSDERLKSLVSNKTTPRTRNEQEIAGYRDVLSTIHESHDFIPVKPSIILQLHRDLYKFSGKSIGGSYKGADNVIAEEDSEGNQFVRFQPVPAWETPAAIDAICEAFDEIMAQTDADPLLIIPMFILDFPLRRVSRPGSARGPSPVPPPGLSGALGCGSPSGVLRAPCGGGRPCPLRSPLCPSLPLGGSPLPAPSPAGSGLRAGKKNDCPKD